MKILTNLAKFSLILGALAENLDSNLEPKIKVELLANSTNLSNSKWTSFDLYYNKGLQAYSQGNWEHVIKYFNHMIDSKNQYHQAIKLCSDECKVTSISKKFEELNRPYGTNLGPAVSLTRAKCNQNCIQNYLGIDDLDLNYHPDLLKALRGVWERA